MLLAPGAAVHAQHCSAAATARQCSSSRPGVTASFATLLDGASAIPGPQPSPEPASHMAQGCVFQKENHKNSKVLEVPYGQSPAEMHAAWRETSAMLTLLCVIGLPLVCHVLSLCCIVLSVHVAAQSAHEV